MDRPVLNYASLPIRRWRDRRVWAIGVDLAVGVVLGGTLLGFALAFAEVPVGIWISLWTIVLAAFVLFHHGALPDWLFWGVIVAVTGAYLLLLTAMIVSATKYSSPSDLWRAMRSEPIHYAIKLSLVSCTLSALLSLLLATPVGYLLARGRFPGKALLDTLLDVPIVLPPMVIGLCLLILFQTPIGRAIDRVVPFTYSVYGVVLAQFIVAAAFAIRQMRTTFGHLDPRPEEVALTLGCSRGQAVCLVTLPAAKRGMFGAFSIAWARSLGEFGPILVFAGATRMKTEVLPTTVWLELTVGNLEAAVAVSLLMIVLSIVVLLAMRAMGDRP